MKFFGGSLLGVFSATCFAQEIVPKKGPEEIVFEWGLGKTYNSAWRDEIHGISTSALFDFELPKDSFYAQIQARGILDNSETNEAIDEDRHSLWFSGRIEFGKFLTKQSSEIGEFGIKIKTEINENTPTSIERAINLDLLPTYRVFDDTFSFEGSLGLSAFSHELDDDLPRSQGFERDRLAMDTLGLICQVNSTFDLGKNYLWNFSGKAVFDEKFQFFETRLGSSLDIPLKILANNTCRPFLRFGVEFRHFDLDDRADALPFESELFITADFIIRFGGGPTPKPFYRSLR